MSPTHTFIAAESGGGYILTLGYISIMAHEVTTTDGEMDQSSSQGAAALSTVHLYYEDTELFSNTAKVIAVREADPEVEGEKVVALVTDETVMHPQGGKEKMAMGSHQICFCSLWFSSDCK